MSERVGGGDGEKSVEGVERSCPLCGSRSVKGLPVLVVWQGGSWSGATGRARYDRQGKTRASSNRAVRTGSPDTAARHRGPSRNSPSSALQVRPAVLCWRWRCQCCEASRTGWQTLLLLRQAGWSAGSGAATAETGRQQAGGRAPVGSPRRRSAPALLPLRAGQHERRARARRAASFGRACSSFALRWTDGRGGERSSRAAARRSSSLPSDRRTRERRRRRREANRRRCASRPTGSTWVGKVVA